MATSDQLDTNNREISGGTPVRIRVLYVEPDDPDAKLFVDYVETTHPDIAVTRVGTAEDVPEGEFDCIVGDLPALEMDPEVVCTQLDSISPLAEMATENCNRDGAASQSHPARTPPLVLFTRTEPLALSREYSRRAATWVKKGDRHNLAFVVEKVRSVTGIGRPADEDVAWQRDEIERVGSRKDLLAVIVAGEGKTLWQNLAFSTFFPTEVPVSESDVAAVTKNAFVNGVEYRRAVDGAREFGEDLEGYLCEIERGEGRNRLVACWNLSLASGTEPLTLELYRDVTDEVRRQQRLDMAETLVMNQGDGLYVLDANGEFTYINDVLADQLGYEREDLVGMHQAEVLAPGELKRGQQVVQSVIDDPDGGREVIDLEHVCKGGEARILSVSFSLVPFDEDGSYQGLVGMTRDVTERAERERQLAQYRRLVETARDPMVVLTVNRELRQCNEAFLELCAGTHTEVRGRPASDVLPDDQAAQLHDAIDRLLSAPDRDSVLYETLVNAVDDEQVFEVVVRPIRHEGALDGFVAYYRDVTVQRKRTVRLQDRNERLERFGTVLSYDLDEPLESLSHAVERFEETGDERELESCRGQIEEMYDLVETLTALAKRANAENTEL